MCSRSAGRGHLTIAAFCAALVLAGVSLPRAQDSPETTYVRITKATARVRSDVGERSSTLGVVESGQRFPLLDYTDAAIKILYRSGDRAVEGWIDRDKGEIVQTAPSPIAVIRPHMRVMGLATAAVAGVAVLIVIVVLLVRRTSARAAARVASNKTLVLVALKPKQIRNSLNNTTTTIESCFSGIGYTIHTTRTVAQFEQRIRHRAPDVVLVDWEAAPGIADEIETSLAARSGTESVPVVHYNAPSNAPASRRPRVRNVYYVGSEVSDRDLFKIIQPHTLGVTQTSIVRKGSDSSAIEGDVSEGGLGAVLQLLEIGQKSGCLMIRQDKPYGVICFEGGNPTYAITNTNRGEKAVYELLDLKSGSFSFVSGRKAPERNCTTSTMGVLMEWARVKDERARA